MGDAETEKFLLSHCTTVFRSAWDNRELLSCVSSDQSTSDYKGHPVLRCRAQFVNLHTAS